MIPFIQLFEQKTTVPYASSGYYTIERTYERVEGTGIKLQFNRNNHGLTTLVNPWSTITKYGYHDSINDIWNISTISPSTGLMPNGRDVIFDFNKYMVITSFDIWNYHYWDNGILRMKLYYWDETNSTWTLIFDGSSKRLSGEGFRRILWFRKDGINSGSGVGDSSGIPKNYSIEPVVRLHYEAQGYSNSGVVDTFVRQEKWAFRYKLSLSNPSGGGTSNALEGMRMKAKIHPTAEPVWTT